MRVVYAPDSYGGFLSAPAACRLVQRVLGLRGIRVDPHPMADGGEGTLEVLRFHGVAEGLEVVESARWIGPGCPGMEGSWHQRSTLGLGRRMARPGDGPLLVGLGGSSTVDGGAGALQALGLILRDRRGRALPLGLPGSALGEVATVHGPLPLRGRLVELLVDVSTPIADAPALYGPQKGMAHDEIPAQRWALEAWAGLLGGWRRGLGLDPLPLTVHGGGAAGGLGYARASAGARIVPGAERLARLTGLAASLRGADAVVLGEGCMDRTSFEGKVAQAVLARARAAGVPRVLALVGSARDLAPAPGGPDRVVATGEPSMEAFIAAIEALGDALLGS